MSVGTIAPLQLAIFHVAYHYCMWAMQVTFQCQSNKKIKTPADESIKHSLGSRNESSYTATMHFSHTILANPELEPHVPKGYSI